MSEHHMQHTEWNYTIWFTLLKWSDRISKLRLTKLQTALYPSHTVRRLRYDLQNRPDRRWSPLGRCEISQSAVAALQIAVRSPRSPRSPLSLNMLKTSAVRSPWKQVTIASQLTRRRVAAGTPRAPWHRSVVAQGARSIAVGSLSGYAYKFGKISAILSRHQ